MTSAAPPAICWGRSVSRASLRENCIRPRTAPSRGVRELGETDEGGPSLDEEHNQQTNRGKPMTDLEQHVNAKGRKELVKQVREKIKELGIQYIYYQFVSVTGRIVGKGVPSDHWESVGERGFQLVYGSTANLFVDRFKNYIGYGPEASELVGIPDPETFCQLPWDKRVARVFCTCFRNREEKVNPGGHLTSDCRGNLRIIHEEFKKAHKGLHLRHGCEPEMMWLKKGA